MLKAAFGIYRQWGFDIFEEILKFQKNRKEFALDTLILANEYQCKIPEKLKQKIKIYIVNPQNTKEIISILEKNNINIIFWYSWSWMIKKTIFENYLSICLHPSPLPKYRGGTPIQHQIIDKRKKSAVTLFKIAQGIDSGPIYKQSVISLAGNINDIFNRMADAGSILTKQLITDALNNRLIFYSQKNLKANPPLKRRTPDQSEIKIEQAQNMNFQDLNNLVRSLLDPYPNVFVKINTLCLQIQEIKKYKILPKKAVTLYSELQNINKKFPLFLKIKDGYAKICGFKIK